MNREHHTPRDTVNDPVRNDPVRIVSDRLSDTYAFLEQQVASLKGELEVLSQQRLEELTEKSKLAARFAALFDVLPGGVVVLDTQGRVIECNRVAGNLIDDSIMGQSWCDVLQEFFISPAGNADGILLKNGSVVGVATTSLSDGNGQIVLLTDQTESRQLQHRLVRDRSILAINNGDQKHLASPVCISRASKSLFELAGKVAVTDCSVLISGESGTGKEVLARFIHEHSPRALHPFVAINCAAIPETMLESILFGHEKGSFTGAHQASAGKFELANGGTLLLDEISEMSPALQAKLLRVLQEREVERVGGKKHIALDVRIIATSNRNLAQAMQDGSFREDLYYRLSVFPLFMPLLRERKEDIVALSKRFIQKYAGKTRTASDIKLTESAVEKLSSHHWPGNVRELENVIQRALVMHQGTLIEADDIVLADGSCKRFSSDEIMESGTGVNQTAEAATLNAELRKHEHEQIFVMLNQKNGNRKETATALGISERSLRYKLAEMRDAGYILK